MTLNQLQKDLIFGSLLGDGNLQTFTNGRSWRYRALHKEEHKEYLFHKYDILKPLCGKTTGPICGIVPNSNSTVILPLRECYFNTLVDSSLIFYANMFYKFDKDGNAIKDVPKNVKKFLTPTALAYFYMDDGALKWLNHSNAMRICTESFSEQGITYLQEAFLELYDIKTTKTKKELKNGTIGFRIAIGEKESSKFRELIKPFLVDCMKYKVSDGKYGHLC